MLPANIHSQFTSRFLLILFTWFLDLENGPTSPSTLMKGVGQAWSSICFYSSARLELIQKCVCDPMWAQEIGSQVFHGLLGLVILSSATDGRAGLRGAGGHLASMW